MLRSMAQLQGRDVLALDGQIGRVVDLYFEDARWFVRYLIVDTGNWLTGRKVLISPHAVRGVEDRSQAVSVDLTCEQVRHSPDIDTDKPVSRQHEAEYFRYFGYPPYWYSWQPATPWPTGTGPTSSVTLAGLDRMELEERRIAEEPRSHLRSYKAVAQYRVTAAENEEVGRVGDLLFDEASWEVPFLVVGIGTGLSARSVLMRAECIQEVDWAASVVKVGQRPQQIASMPSFEADSAAARAAEDDSEGES